MSKSDYSLLKQGLKIPCYEVSSIWGVKYGLREDYTKTDIQVPYSLLIYWLQENNLISIKNGCTDDLIALNFNYKSYNVQEECEKLEKLLSQNERITTRYKYDKLQNDERLNNFTDKKPSEAISKSSQDLRIEAYENGIIIYHKNKTNDRIKAVKYKKLYRSSGKAKQGGVIFCKQKFWSKAYKFMNMGMSFKTDKPALIVEEQAYMPLIASRIEGMIDINPEQILVLKDIGTKTKKDVVSIEKDNNNVVSVRKDNYELTSTMFDGQGLIDKSLFPKGCRDFILLRQHMFKANCFSTNMTTFFKDYAKKHHVEYEKATTKDMWGKEHYLKDIKLIVTDTAIKWLKFDITFEQWADKIRGLNNKFGIVKTGHKSKWGDVQRMSYQMTNTLNVEDMPQIFKTTEQFIEELKKPDNIAYKKFLKMGSTKMNANEVILRLLDEVENFDNSSFFQSFKRDDIRQFIFSSVKNGKLLQYGDNLTFVGSPYAMLLHSVGISVDEDKTLQPVDIGIQVYTTRFKDGENLAVFRSPHNAKNNVAYLQNTWSDEMQKYFNFGEQTVALNTNKTHIQDRLNGCDQDGDMGFVTNQKEIVEIAKECELEFLTIVNNIPQIKKKYLPTKRNYAMVDNNIASSQYDIGESSNVAQVSQTYMHTFPQNKEKYASICEILSVLAQVSIDSAKRSFDLDVHKTINNIRKEINIKELQFPKFWLPTHKDFDKTKINENLNCPMDWLQNYKTSIPRKKGIPISNFINEYPTLRLEATSKKVIKILNKINLNFYENYNSINIYESDYENLIILESDFEDCVKELKKLKLGTKYKSLISWLVSTTFKATETDNKDIKQLNKNKCLLLRVLYEVSPDTVINVFKKKGMK